MTQSLGDFAAISVSLVCSQPYQLVHRLTYSFMNVRPQPPSIRFIVYVPTTLSIRFPKTVGVLQRQEYTRIQGEGRLKTSSQRGRERKREKRTFQIFHSKIEEVASLLCHWLPAIFNVCLRFHDTKLNVGR